MAEVHPITWEAAAADALHRLVPGRPGLFPSAISVAAANAGMTVDVARLSTYGELDPFAGYTSGVLLDLCQPVTPPRAGDLVIVTDDSSPDDSPHRVAAGAVRKFLSDGARLHNRDTVILAPSQRRVILLHHDGWHDEIRA